MIPSIANNSGRNSSKGLNGMSKSTLKQLVNYLLGWDCNKSSSAYIKNV